MWWPSWAPVESKDRKQEDSSVFVENTKCVIDDLCAVYSNGHTLVCFVTRLMMCQRTEEFTRKEGVKGADVIGCEWRWCQLGTKSLTVDWLDAGWCSCPWSYFPHQAVIFLQVLVVTVSAALTVWPWCPAAAQHHWCRGRRRPVEALHPASLSVHWTISVLLWQVQHFTALSTINKCSVQITSSDRSLSLFAQSPEEADSIVSRLDENTELRNKTSKCSQSELSEPLQKLL